MSDPRFEAEKAAHIGRPAAEGTSTAPLVIPAPAAEGGRDPAVTPPFKNLRVRDRYDCEDMIRLALASETFRKHDRELADDKVIIEWEVRRLDPQSGGGRTLPESGGRRFTVILDPETVLPGAHIFEVFLHEFGHVVELHRSIRRNVPEKKYYHEFTNRVQAELGLRITADSHREDAALSTKP